MTPILKAFAKLATIPQLPRKWDGLADSLALIILIRGFQNPGVTCGGMGVGCQRSATAKPSAAFPRVSPLQLFEGLKWKKI
jgi:hypothetical protein